MSRYRSGIAETSASSSASDAGLICLTSLADPPPRTRHGFAAIGCATVLVHGAHGAVGSLAAQLAHWAGAAVITTVRRTDDLPKLQTPAMAQAVALDVADPADAIRAHAPDGVDRIIEVAFSDNVDIDAAVAANGAVIAAYATRADRPDFPFWPMLFDNTPSVCWAATTSHPRPSSRPPLTSPPLPAPATSPSRSPTPYLWSKPRPATSKSTPTTGAASCSPSRTDRKSP
jgi:NADPH:quinone reductase-like Zn-dependent oxidoreductase